MLVESPVTFGASCGRGRTERMEVEREAVKIQTNVRAWLLQRNYKTVRQSVTRCQAGASSDLSCVDRGCCLRID